MKLIIHHWDADGICAAALLYGEGFDVMCPIIGNYFLTDDEIEEIEKMGYDEIYVVDFAMDRRSLMRLLEIGNIKVFDHHLTEKINGIEYINPILEGRSEEEYPSASWVVNEYMEKKENLLAFLGAVGDMEHRIKATKFYGRLKSFMEEEGLKFDEMLKMVKLMESSYKIGNRKEIEKAVRCLSKERDVKNFILKNKIWSENLKKVEEEIAKILNEGGKRIGKVFIKEMNSKYNIISTIARKLWEKNEYVVVINHGYFDDACQIYVRGKNVYPLIEIAKRRGYIAGGKRNVVGAIIPKNGCHDFIKKILEEIG